jgi:hypothetical protein
MASRLKRRIPIIFGGSGGATGLSTAASIGRMVRGVLGASAGAASSAYVGSSSGSSGGLTHGSLYTVSGSGLGTRPDYNYGNHTWGVGNYHHLHYLWCDFSKGEPAAYTDAGWNAVLNGATARWYNPQGVSQAVPAIGTNTNENGRYQTGPSANGWCYRRFQNNTSVSRYGGLYLPVSGPGFASGYTGEYFSCKYRFNGNPANGMVDGHLKNFRRSFSGLIEVMTSMNGTAISAATTAAPGGQWAPPLNSQTSSALQTNRGLPLNNWGRVEMLVKVPGSASGTWAMAVNGTWGAWSNSSTPVPYTDIPVTPQSLTVFGGATYTPANGGGNYLFTVCSESVYAYSGNPYTQDVTDIYYDLTQARVEVAQGSTSEVQLISSWSPTSIVIIANKGALTSGAATLRVYGSSGSVLHTQSVVVS